MTRQVCRIVIRTAAVLAPSAFRARWREEWLAEVAASPTSSGLLRRCLGAPRDAWSLRWTLRPPDRAPRLTGAHWWSGASADPRYALRQLRRRPGHAVTIVLCLGIGLTVAVSAFSLVNALVFNDLPGLKDRTALLRVFVSYDGVFGSEGMGKGQTAAAGPLSSSDFRAFDRPHASLAGLAAEGPWNFLIALHGAAVSTRGAFVSARYFQVLGTEAAAGRLLVATDDEAQAVPVAVIGYHLWQDRFQGRSDLVGQSMSIGNRTFAIVGVAQAKFTGIQPPDVGQSPLELPQVWLPAHFATAWPGVPAADAPWLSVVGRLASGATREQARADMDAAAARLSDAQPASRGHAHVEMRSHGLSTADGVGFVALVVSLFMTLPLTVLVIACANVANLQLARATERARELTVRQALGATRGQLVRLLSGEVLGLALLATALGWAGATAVLAGASGLFPLPLPLDRRVFFFACGLVVTVTALSGIAPAWISTRRSAAAGLKQAAQTGGLGHTRLRGALVGLQVALSLVLLFVAALSVRSLREQLSDIQARARDLVTADVSVTSLDYTSAQAGDLARRLVTGVAADSRVRAVGVADASGGLRYWRSDDDPTVRRYADGGAVDAGWFHATEARLLAGRLFGDRDLGTPSAVLTQGLASSLWPSGSAIGQVIRVQRSPAMPVETADVVGVVADRSTLPGASPDRAVYLPLPKAFPTAFALSVRTPDPRAIVGAVRAVLLREEPRVAWTPIVPEADRLSGGLVGLRYVLWLFTVLSALAIGLASAGLYAVMSYMVSLRRRELAVRMAVGAARRDLVALVLRQALRLVIIGSAIGFGLAIPLGYAMRAQLLGVSAIDPFAVAPTLAMLLAVGLAAGFVPARRAAAVDPLTALKEE